MTILRGSRAWFEQQYAPLDSAGIDGFATMIRGSQQVRLRQIVALLEQTTPTGALLDVGCGTGVVLGMLNSRRFSQRVGVDLSHTGLRHAARRVPTGLFIQAALPHLPFAEARFAGVVCLEVLYYLEASTQRATVRELARLLRPGGWLCLSARLDDGSRYLAEDVLPQLAEEAGLRVERLVWHRVRLYRPLEQRLLALAQGFGYLQTTAQRIQSGAIPPEEWCSWKWRLFGAATRTPGLSWLPAWWVAGLAGLRAGILALLGLRWPVWLAYGLGRWFFPKSSRTGQVLLCRKPE